MNHQSDLPILLGGPWNWVFIKRPLLKMKVNDNSNHNLELINHRHVSKIIPNVPKTVGEISEPSKLNVLNYLHRNNSA